MRNSQSGNLRLPIVGLLLLVAGCTTLRRVEYPDSSLQAYRANDRVSSASNDGSSVDITSPAGPVTLVSHAQPLANQSGQHKPGQDKSGQDEEDVAPVPSEKNSVTPDALNRVEPAALLAPPVLPEHAESDLDWTLETVLQFAMQHHPVLAARQCEVQAARARLLGAGLFTNPRLVLDTQAPTNGGPTELRGRIMFEVPFGAKRRARKAVACAGIQRAQMALSREVEDVLLEAGDAAVEVLYLQERLDLQEQISRLAARRAEIQESDVDRRMVELDISDRLKADLDAADREIDQLDTANMLRLASLRLSRSIGMTPSTSLQMEGRLVVGPMPLKPLEAMLAEGHKAVSVDEAMAALTESRSLYGLARADAIPETELGPRYHDDLGTSDKQVGARFETDLPVFDRNQDEIQERGAEIAANRALLNAAQVAARGDLAALYAELEFLRDGITLLETGAMKRLEYYEGLIRDPAARKGITEVQASDISRKSLELKMKHLELRHRFARLFVALLIRFGDDCGSEPILTAAR